MENSFGFLTRLLLQKYNFEFGFKSIDGSEVHTFDFFNIDEIDGEELFSMIDVTILVQLQKK